MKIVGRMRQLWWHRQRWRPPRCPRGWITALPDFVGVGAQKAGTTWWYELIAAHPQVVHHGRPKELHYFSRFDATPEAIDAYTRFFPRPEGYLAGEWTPRYMHDPTIPPKLAAAVPDARLLMLIRDPVERYRSGITMQQGTRVSDPAADSFARGRYADQIENILRSFPVDQLLVLQYERCRIDPEAELARTYRYLGIDDAYRPERLRRGVNVTRGEKLEISDDEIDRLVDAYEDDVRRLVTLVPDLDLDLWPRFRRLA